MIGKIVHYFVDTGRGQQHRHQELIQIPVNQSIPSKSLEGRIESQAPTIPD